MTNRQGDLSLLGHPVARELLKSAIPARLAYNWLDGTPRVVPIWFHWNGQEFILASPARAPKLRALPHNPRVAITVDDHVHYPYKVLLVRGDASIKMQDGLVPEFILAARRYFGDEEGDAWLKSYGSMIPGMGRIAIRPLWVGILDFETRYPSAVSA